jgi:hypothetical protein
VKEGRRDPTKIEQQQIKNLSNQPTCSFNTGANVGTQGIHHKTTPSTPRKEADKVNAKAAASGNPTINSNNSV